MASFTFKGTNYEVASDGARELKPRSVGSETESFDGKLRSTTRAQFRAWELKLGPTTLTALAVLRADALAGKGAASGDVLGASFQCFVELGEVNYQRDEAAGTVFALPSIAVRQAE